MFVQGFGEIITDILTVNPELSGVATASSILDTSNYTFQAITYGKDAEGFNFHAHSVSTVNRVNGESDGIVSGYNDDHVIAVNFTNVGTMVSSYPASASHNTFASSYISLPQFPAVNHSRLELKSTRTTPDISFSAVGPDLGHYPNTYIDSNLSNAWTILGGFSPPSSAGKTCQLYDSAGALIASGVLSGIYNQNNVVDKDGYVSVSQVSGLDSQLGDSQGFELSGGAVVFSSAAAGIDARKGSTGIAVVPQHGDGVTLALYGGINHLGVYCMDTRAMLASGITPPYSYDALNNNRIYKLVSKVSFVDNLINHEDISILSGLIDGLNRGTGLLNSGPTYSIKFNFL